MNLERMSPGETIKQIRLKRGRTQREVADAIGASIATISRWEKGDRRIPVQRFEQVLEFLSAEYTVKY